MNEILEQSPSIGLFAECFAKSGGDEQKTKALYLERRASEVEEIELALIRAEQERVEEFKRAEAQRLEAIKKAEAERLESVMAKYTLEKFIEENQEEKHLKYYNRRQISEMHQKWREEKLKQEGF